MDLQLLLKVILLSKTILRGEITLQNAPCVITSLEFVAHQNQNSQFGIPKTRKLLLQQDKKVLQGLEDFWQNVICACLS